MKNTLYTLALLVSFSSFGQIVAKNKLYRVIYSEFYQQPISLEYEYPNPFEYKSLRLDTVSFKPMVVKRVAKFDSLNYATLAHTYEGEIMLNANGYYVDKNGTVTNSKIYDEEEKQIVIEYPKSTTTKIDTIIKETKLTKFIAPIGVITSDDGDYKQPYDKGHLAPKQSFPNDEYNDFMFSFLNCALMHRSLNRGLWKALENKERGISKSAVLKVKILVSFGKNNVVDGGASVPDFFTKILDYRKFDENNKEISVREVYTFPNDASVKGKDIENYKVTALSL
tara:strand:- start:1109 stop:1954 length:846 start_codon:yes stop_codon:yes gene_type:complete